MPELICIDFAIKNQGEKIKWDWFSGAVDFPFFFSKSFLEYAGDGVCYFMA